MIVLIIMIILISVIIKTIVIIVIIMIIVNIVIIAIIVIIATFNFLPMVTVLTATQWVTPEIVCYVKSNNPMMRNTSA